MESFESWWKREVIDTLRPQPEVTSYGTITCPTWMSRAEFERWLDANPQAEALARRRGKRGREFCDRRDAAIAERDRLDRQWDRRMRGHTRQAGHSKEYTGHSSREITESKRERVKESERAAGPGLRSRISSITCARSHFASQGEAARWIRDHDFRADKAEDVAVGYVFRQRDLAPDAKGFRTIQLDPGVEGVAYEGER